MLHRFSNKTDALEYGRAQNYNGLTIICDGSHDDNVWMVSHRYDPRVQFLLEKCNRPLEYLGCGVPFIYAELNRYEMEF